MFFSVLIPVYNTSKYLDECIQSVLSQTEKDYEIVLIDDGSTDHSGDICDYYAKQHSFIRVIHKENEGLLLTRRRGFQEAKGDYFVSLDSDDYLCDNKALARIKKLIIEKGCDLVLFNYLVEKEIEKNNQNILLFDKPDGYVFEETEKIELYNKILVGRDLNALVIKVPSREIVDIDVDYSLWDKTLFRSQSEDLFQSMPILTNAKKIGYVRDILYFYRWHGGSISRGLRLEYYNAYKTVYQREDEFIPLWKVSDDAIQKNKIKRINMILSNIVYCYNNVDDKKQWLIFIESLSTDNFFRRLFDVYNKKDILLYYRLLGFFIMHRMKISLQLCIKTVSFISNLKNKAKFRL